MGWRGRGLKSKVVLVLGIKTGKPFRVFGHFEGVNHIENIAIHELIQGIYRHPNAMIGHPALGEIVGSDFG